MQAAPAAFPRTAPPRLPPPLQIAIDIEPSSSTSGDASASSGGTAAERSGTAPLAFATPQRQFAQSLVRRRLLQSYNWSLLSVQESEWVRLRSDKERQG